MKLAVFSDLDGTLLDHESYSFDAARPALDRLRALGVPVVLSTSKTAAEVASLHQAMALGDAPAIVENGAGIYRPGQPITQSAEYSRLRAILAELNNPAFRGFGDMTAQEVADLTGLAPQSAAQAKARGHSEPGIWSGSEAAQQDFIAELAGKGVAARSGGRFLTLSFGRTKADGLRAIQTELGATRTIALGDAPNDTEMLQAADIGVIIRNDHGPGVPHLPGEDTGVIRRSALPGPQGWGVEMNDILDDWDQRG